MPGGSVMGIPSEIGPFLTTKLFSWPGKFRAAADLFTPSVRTKGRSTRGYLFTPRLGDEVVENLIEPYSQGFMPGILTSMSLMATFPNFYHLEQKYGSLVRGTKATKKRHQRNQQAQTNAARKRNFYYN